MHETVTGGHGGGTGGVVGAVGRGAGGVVRAAGRLEEAPLERVRTRRSGQRVIDVALAAAEHLRESEASLLRAVFERGQPVRELAAVAGVTPRSIRRRVAGILRRVTRAEFVFVVHHRRGWTPRTARLASLVVLQGRTVAQAAREVGCTYHTARKVIQGVRLMAESAGVRVVERAG
jgi:hypothetical protein